MTTTLRATAELVAVKWIQGLFPTPMVNTTLPKPNADGTISWAATGFVVVTTVGGSPDPYMPVRNPVMSVDCWAVNPNSTKPPWDRANNSAEEILAACQDPANFNSELVIQQGSVVYPSVKVLSGMGLNEPRRIRDDQASYARYSFDLQLKWAEI